MPLCVRPFASILRRYSLFMNESLRRVGQILELVTPIRMDLDHVCRFGSENDGGYVLVKDFSDGDFLLSMGVANDVNFELELISLLSGAHLYDDSIVALPKVVSNSFFYNERIGGSGCTSITEAMERIPDHFDLILKVDIEGSEWEALDSLKTEELNKFRQIVVEYHWFEKLIDDQDYSRMLRVLSKLSTTHFVLNAHPNNCGDTLIIENIAFPSIIEVTYLRRLDYSSYIYSKDDLSSVSIFNKPCSPNIPELYLPSIREFEKLNLESNSIGMYSRFAFNELTRERDELTRERDELVASTIWKLTKPYRRLRTRLKLSKLN